MFSGTGAAGARVAGAWGVGVIVGVSVCGGTSPSAWPMPIGSFVTAKAGGVNKKISIKAVNKFLADFLK